MRGKSLPDIEWQRLPLERFQQYADKVGADFIQITEDSIPLLCLPTTLTAYQKCNMLKFYLLNHFISSDYERMIYLDLDILINREARNIFDQVECKGIHMAVSGDKKQDASQQYWFKHHFNVDHSTHLYNGGVIYANKKSIKEYYQNVPQLGEWIDFYKKYNLEQNLTSPGGYRICEQNLLALFFHEQSTPVHELPQNWNRPAFDQREGDDFVHYFGVGGKYILDTLYDIKRDMYFNY